MKAISLKLPWAWLMVTGRKMPKFRNRRDSFSGECFIHASKTFDEDCYYWMAEHFPDTYTDDLMYHRDYIKSLAGKVIGKIIVLDCLTYDKAKLKYPNDMWIQYSKGELGKYAFITTSPIEFSPQEQFEIKGKVFPLFFEPELRLKQGG